MKESHKNTFSIIDCFTNVVKGTCVYNGRDPSAGVRSFEGFLISDSKCFRRSFVHPALFLVLCPFKTH